MKKILSGLVVLAFTFSLGTMVLSKRSGTATIDWHKGGKSARIDYAKHRAKGVKCNACHRKHKSGKRYYKGCGKCHSTRSNAKKVGHKLCLDCHRKTSGPKSCSGCH